MTKQGLRTFGSLVMIGVFGLTATGCSIGGSGTPATVAHYQVRIWRTGQNVDPIQGNITDFQKQNPKVTATYTRKPAGNYEDASLRSMASRQGPDIWSIQDDWLGDEESVIAPLPDTFFKQTGAACPNDKTGAANPACLATVPAAKLLFPAGIVSQITSTDGKHILGVPSNVDALQLYVNMDILSQANADFKKSQPGASDATLTPVRQLLSKPPLTWNDLIAQAKYITQRSGNSITRSAVAFGTADNVPASADIVQLLMLQNGVPVVSSDRLRSLLDETITTSSGATTRPGENALQFYASFADPSKDTYTWNASMPSALDAFGQGKVAMVVAYSDFGTQLKAKYPKMKPTVTAVPQISATSAAVNLIRFSVETVTQTADSQAAAFALLQSYGAPSTESSMASDLKLRSPYLATLNKNTGDYFNQEVLTGQAVYKKNRISFDTAFRQMITDVAQNGVAVGASLDAATQSLNALLTDSQS